MRLLLKQTESKVKDKDLTPIPSDPNSLSRGVVGLTAHTFGVRSAAILFAPIMRVAMHVPTLNTWNVIQIAG